MAGVVVGTAGGRRGGGVGVARRPARLDRPASFRGHGSIDEAYVVGAPPRTHLTLVNGAGHRVGSGRVDRLGSLIVRNLAPGSGFRFEEGRGRPARATAPFAVLSHHLDSTPPPSFYSSQHLHAGLNYVRMRDGVLIAATVRLPPGKTLADGPFPTVIEYSGYGTAAPHSLIAAEEGEAPTNDPLLPDTSTVVGRPRRAVARLRRRQRPDAGHGMFGWGLRPPRLPVGLRRLRHRPDRRGPTMGAAPQGGSGGDLVLGALPVPRGGDRPAGPGRHRPLEPDRRPLLDRVPGRDLQQRVRQELGRAAHLRRRTASRRGVSRGPRPRSPPGTGPAWPTSALHPEAEGLATLVGPGLARTPSLFDRRSPAVWATHIKVPVFLVGSLEDEEVGPQWPALISALKGDKDVYVTHR